MALTQCSNLAEARKFNDWLSVCACVCKKGKVIFITVVKIAYILNQLIYCLQIAYILNMFSENLGVLVIYCFFQIIFLDIISGKSYQETIYCISQHIIQSFTGKYIYLHYHRPEYQHRASDNVWQIIELCPTNAFSQRTQLSSVKLKKFFLSYLCFKTQKFSVSIGLCCSGFPFY